MSFKTQQHRKTENLLVEISNSCRDIMDTDHYEALLQAISCYMANNATEEELDKYKNAITAIRNIKVSIFQPAGDREYLKGVREGTALVLKAVNNYIDNLGV